MPETLGQHQRIRCVHAVDDTANVDIQRPVPVLQAQLVHLTADADARVVEHQIESAMLSMSILDHRPNSVTRRWRCVADRG